MKLSDIARRFHLSRERVRGIHLEIKERNTSSHLDQMIAEATVDCYNESEQRCGLFTMIEENLAVPFRTSVLGVEVSVEKADLTEAEEIVVVCRHGSRRQRISMLELPLPDPRPDGAEWIEAYRRWSRGK